MRTSKLSVAMYLAAWGLGISFLTPLPAAEAATGTAITPGALSSSSTIHSIGLEWNIAGDTNHNAQGTVQYRIQGQTAWKSALPPIRVDFNGVNTLAGSILFLDPGTTYE